MVPTWEAGGPFLRSSRPAPIRKPLLRERTLRSAACDLRRNSSLMAVLIASQTRSVFNASSTVLPGRISAAIAAEMGHTRTSDGLYQGLLDDSFLYIQGSACRHPAAAHTSLRRGVRPEMSFDFFGLYPLCLLRDRSSAVIYALGYWAHIFYFL